MEQDSDVQAAPSEALVPLDQRNVLANRTRLQEVFDYLNVTLGYNVASLASFYIDLSTGEPVAGFAGAMLYLVGVFEYLEYESHAQRLLELLPLDRISYYEKGFYRTMELAAIRAGLGDDFRLCRQTVLDKAREFAGHLFDGVRSRVLHAIGEDQKAEALPSGEIEDAEVEIS